MCTHSVCIQEPVVCLGSSTAPTTPPPSGSPAPRTTRLWPFFTSCLWRTAPPYRAAVWLTQSCTSQDWRRGRPTSSTCGSSVTDSGSRNILTCVSRELIHPWGSFWGPLGPLWTKVSLTHVVTWWFWFEHRGFHLTIHRTFYAFCSVQHIPGIVSEMTIQGGWNQKKDHVKVNFLCPGGNLLLDLFVFHDNPSLPYSQFVASLELDLELDISSTGLIVVVPWSLPEDLQDAMLEPRAKIGKIFKDKVDKHSVLTSAVMYCRSCFHPNYTQCWVKAQPLRCHLRACKCCGFISGDKMSFSQRILNFTFSN